MNVQEQLRAFQTKRNEASERQLALMAKSGEEGRTLDDEESAEYDSLDTEIKHVDAHIARLKNHVDPSETKEVKSKKAPTVIIKSQDREDEFPGQSFVRRIIAKAVSKLEDHERSPAQIAKQRWGKTNPTLCRVIESGIVTRSAVEGGSGDVSLSPDPWGSELVSADSRFTGDFIEFLHDKTVFDQLPLREVPANVTIKGQDGAATGYWVGESTGVPVSAQSFSTVNLTYLKVGALAVVSNELLKHSSPAAEMFVRDALVAASAEKIDTSFLGGGAGTAGVEPAGILQGVSTLGSNGYDAAAVRDDIRELYAPFLSAKHSSGLILVMTPSRAKATSLLVNTLGQTEFPGLMSSGGTLLGDRVVTGDNVGATTVILLDPREIWKIGDTGVEVSLSRDATIEMDTAPTVNSQEPDSADGEFVSMYQTESTAFKIVRPMNFQKRRTSAAAFISDAGWGDSSTTTA